MQTAEQTDTTVNGRKCATVMLQEPVKRGDTLIASIQLMKPRTADLRGLLIPDVLQMDVDTLAKLLPRITVPTLTKPDIDNLDPADLVACAMGVAGFLVPTSVMDQAQA